MMVKLAFLLSAFALLHASVALDNGFDRPPMGFVSVLLSLADNRVSFCSSNLLESLELLRRGAHRPPQAERFVGSRLQ